MLSNNVKIDANNFFEMKTHCKPIPCNENRVFPVKFSHREIPGMKTGVPAMRTGVPCNENRFFPVWKTVTKSHNITKWNDFMYQIVKWSINLMSLNQDCSVEKFSYFNTRFY